LDPVLRGPILPGVKRLLIVCLLGALVAGCGESPPVDVFRETLSRSGLVPEYVGEESDGDLDAAGAATCAYVRRTTGSTEAYVVSPDGQVEKTAAESFHVTTEQGALIVASFLAAYCPEQRVF
jgi:hypothetical protein